MTTKQVQAELVKALSVHTLPERPAKKHRSAKEVREINRLKSAASAGSAKRVLKATKRNSCTQGGHYSNRHNSTQLTGKIRLADLELDGMQ